MLDVEPVPGDGRALAALAREAGVALAGLRLADDSLILKLERGGRAQQVRIAGGPDSIRPATPSRCGLNRIRGCRSATPAVASFGGCCACRPLRRGGARARDLELLRAFDLKRAGLSQPEIAAALWDVAVPARWVG